MGVDITFIHMHIITDKNFVILVSEPLLVIAKHLLPLSTCNKNCNQSAGGYMQ